MSDEFTLEDASKANEVLRKAAGLGPQRFPAPAFVAMISDEIEALREAGKTDADIAGLLTGAGITLEAGQITQFYAPPEKRRRGR